MIVITQTPVRMSFLGGGTDYKEFFMQHGGGEVLATAIDKFSYIQLSSMHDFFDYQLRVSYRKTELVHSIDEVEHPSVRECLKYMRTPLPLEIHYSGDLPARTGLGSSSSFTVGLLNALYAMQGRAAGHAQLAHDACEVEHSWIRERVGFQDQYMAAFGGIRHITFHDNGEISATPVPISSERRAAFRSHLLVFYTGLTRLAHKVLKEQLENTTQNRNTDVLLRMRSLVKEGVTVLSGSDDIGIFGDLLHESWQLKQTLSTAIATQEISQAYDAARNAGARGGKLLGAGGGGFLLFFAPPETHDAIRTVLAPMKELHFEFEPTGSRLIFYET